MTSLIEHYPWLKALWTVWFFLLFVGLIIWTMWPSRRARWTELSQIPLRDTANPARKDHD